jgi:hypothetical protein
MRPFVHFSTLASANVALADNYCPNSLGYLKVTTTAASNGDLDQVTFAIKLYRRFKAYGHEGKDAGSHCGDSGVACIRPLDRDPMFTFSATKFAAKQTCGNFLDSKFDDLMNVNATYRMQWQVSDFEFTKNKGNSGFNIDSLRVNVLDTKLGTL